MKKKNQPMVTDLGMTQKIELVDKDVKTAVITAFLTDQNVEETMKKAQLELLEMKKKEV